MPGAMDLFAEWWSPLKVRFWLVPEHWDALAVAAEDGATSRDEMEGLNYEWQAILSGDRGTLGEVCLCRRETLHCPTAVSGGGVPRDTLSSLAGLIGDLERAADALPDNWLHWQAVRRVYAVQHRTDPRDPRGYWARMSRRRVPPEAEPYIDGRGQGRRLVARRMALELGWRPKEETIEPMPEELLPAA